MSRSRRQLGQRGEQLAAARLPEMGYEIVERNYRCPAGEIDLVARKDGLWIFVEVRARRSADFGTPEESVTRRKRGRLIAAAETYLQARGGPDADWRIDFVAVEYSPGGELRRFEVIENAIAADRS